MNLLLKKLIILVVNANVTFPEIAKCAMKMSEVGAIKSVIYIWKIFVIASTIFTEPGELGYGVTHIQHAKKSNAKIVSDEWRISSKKIKR